MSVFSCCQGFMVEKNEQKIEGLVNSSEGLPARRHSPLIGLRQNHCQYSTNSCKEIGTTNQKKLASISQVKEKKTQSKEKTRKKILKFSLAKTA
jgi:hypothetical protein